MRTNELTLMTNEVIKIKSDTGGMSMIIKNIDGDIVKIMSGDANQKLSEVKE